MFLTNVASWWFEIGQVRWPLFVRELCLGCLNVARPYFTRSDEGYFDNPVRILMTNVASSRHDLSVLASPIWQNLQLRLRYA